VFSNVNMLAGSSPTSNSVLLNSNFTLKVMDVVFPGFSLAWREGSRRPANSKSIARFIGSSQ
jgi:hypothetical protein